MFCRKFWVCNLISKFWLFCLFLQVWIVGECHESSSKALSSRVSSLATPFFWNLNLPITRLQNVFNIFILIQREGKSSRNKNAFEVLKFFSSVSRVFEQSAVISNRYWIHHSLFWNLNLPITRLQNVFNIFILIQREGKSSRNKNAFEVLKFFSSVSRVFEQSAVISNRYWIHHSLFWNLNLPFTRLQNPYNLFFLIQREEKSSRIKNLF